MTVHRQHKSSRKVTAVAENISDDTNIAATSKDIGSTWKIWAVINELEANGLNNNTNNSCLPAKNNNNNNNNNSDAIVVDQVIQILKLWGHKWAGEQGWNTFLNKKSLQHEIEESIIALQLFSNWVVERRSGPSVNNDQQHTPSITLVDACCGKGITSLLASYLFRGRTDIVSDIIMLDKQKDINWNHIVSSNKDALEDERPLIHAWGGCNLHEIDTMVSKFEKHIDNTKNTNGQQQQIALVGIHLCKNLSPSCVGIVNALGSARCPYLCLAPCCLPRQARNAPKKPKISNNIVNNQDTTTSASSVIIPIRSFETNQQKNERIKANVKRTAARTRLNHTPCYLCSEIHQVTKCNLLPTNKNERIEIIRKAASALPCWKCGEIGHKKDNCPNEQASLAVPPIINLNLMSLYDPNVIQNNSLFENYCDLLSTTLQRDNIKVIDVGLINHSAHITNESNKDNWNAQRKSIYIQATS